MENFKDFKSIFEESRSWYWRRLCKLNIFNCYDHLFPRIEHSKCYFFVSQDYVYDPSTVIGSEDCLYVNIFTKRGMEGDDAGLKKVLFWIHGGAFIFGGAQHYPATYIMEEDVVLVNQFNKEDSSNAVISK